MSATTSADTGPSAIVAVLLACGAGTRFGRDKLLHPLADGTPMAVAALRRLLTVVPRAVAVVRAGETVLANRLREAGAEVIDNSNCAAGLGHSIAAGVQACPRTTGWIIALADMPFVQSATIAAVVDGLNGGARICAPCYRGQRGHPVGFAAALREELIRLTGDEGARSVIARHHDAALLLDRDDRGCIRDIDRPEDLSD